MFGRLEPNRNSSKQPIDHGSSRTVDTALSPPQSPYPQPTGALHPATLAPLSASRSSSYSHQPPQLAPYRPLAPAYDPTRPNPPSSVGLHGLAEAAMMEEARDSAPLDRRLPPPLTQRPSNEDQGRFWEQRPPQPRPQSVSRQPSYDRFRADEIGLDNPASSHTTSITRSHRPSSRTRHHAPSSQTCPIPSSSVLLFPPHSYPPTLPPHPNPSSNQTPSHHIHQREPSSARQHQPRRGIQPADRRGMGRASFARAPSPAYPTRSTPHRRGGKGGGESGS